MTDPAAPKSLMKLQEVASRLGVSRRTLHNWIVAGKCPIRPVAGSKPPKWRTADVEAFERGDDVQ